MTHYLVYVAAGSLLGVAIAAVLFRVSENFDRQLVPL